MIRHPLLEIQHLAELGEWQEVEDYDPLPIPTRLSRMAMIIGPAEGLGLARAWVLI